MDAFEIQSKNASGGDAPPPNSYSPSDFLTPSQAREAREKRETPIVFELKHTGGKALVRLATLGDVAALSALPDRMQRRVLQMINDIRSISDTNTTKPDGSLDVDNVIRLMKGDQQTVDIHCLMGFVKPKLIWSEAERTDDEQVVLSDVDPRDRKAYFDWAQGKSEVEAEKIAPFPEQSPDDVETGGTVGDSDPAIGLAELTLSGVQ